VTTDVETTQAHTDRLVLASRRGRVGLIELNRPAVHNALNDALLSKLIAEIDIMKDSPEVRVLLLTGTGQSFCSGDDLKAAAAATPQQFATTIGLLQKLTSALLDLRKPVIAALNGPAFGGGLELALNCDIRIATTAFQCATPEVRLGLTLTNGASILLPSLIGSGKARYLLFSGARVDARWCLEAGLVDELTTADALLPRAMAIAEEIALGAPAALAATRTLLNAPLREAMTAALILEADVCVSTHRAAGLEGLRAYLARQMPRWLQ
jgi:enoyl-CoA hydratase/carnithine racemase